MENANQLVQVNKVLIGFQFWTLILILLMSHPKLIYPLMTVINLVVPDYLRIKNVDLIANTQIVKKHVLFCLSNTQPLWQEKKWPQNVDLTPIIQVLKQNVLL